MVLTRCGWSTKNQPPKKLPTLKCSRTWCHSLRHFNDFRFGKHLLSSPKVLNRHQSSNSWGELQVVGSSWGDVSPANHWSCEISGRDPWTLRSQPTNPVWHPLYFGNDRSATNSHLLSWDNITKVTEINRIYQLDPVRL